MSNDNGGLCTCLWSEESVDENRVDVVCAAGILYILNINRTDVVCAAGILYILNINRIDVVCAAGILYIKYYHILNRVDVVCAAGVLYILNILSHYSVQLVSFTFWILSHFQPPFLNPV